MGRRHRLLKRDGRGVKPQTALISTTTSSGRVRGFTVELLFHLKDGPRRCRDLAKITEKPRNYVYTYLKNMRIYGLTEKNGVFWNLTVLGRDFLSYLNIVYNNIIERQKKEKRKTKERIKKVESLQPKRLRQVRFDLWLQNSNLSDTEKEVVEVLLKHYNETGSKFILVKDIYELAERLTKHPDTIMEALKNLRQDNILYLYRSRIEGYWKIGLKKLFLELIFRHEGV
jgi:predicted transcriptional regulator